MAYKKGFTSSWDRREQHEKLCRSLVDGSSPKIAATSSFESISNDIVEPNGLELLDYELIQSALIEHLLMCGICATKEVLIRRHN